MADKLNTDDFKTAREDLIREAFLLVDSMSNFSLSVDPAPQFYSEVGITSETGNVLACIADLSFKLYLKYHTENEDDLRRISAYLTVQNAINSFYQGTSSPEPYWLATMLKLVYPQIKQDSVLDDLADFFWKIRTKQQQDPAKLFYLSMRLTNHLSGVTHSVLKHLEFDWIHEKLLKKNKDPNWEAIRPIYDGYAQYRDKGSPRAVFGSFFWAGTGSKCDNTLKLEYVLKKLPGEWGNPEYNDRYKRVETENEYSQKIYKRWEANFNRQYERDLKENAKDERMIVELMEKRLWKSLPLNQLAIPTMRNLTEVRDVWNQETVFQIRSKIRNISP